MVLVEDGPLDLVHDPPGDRERWRVNGRAVAEGVQVDFDVDYELSGFRAALLKIIFGGLSRAHAAIHRLDPHPPKRFLLTPAPRRISQYSGSRPVGHRLSTRTGRRPVWSGRSRCGCREAGRRRVANSPVSRSTTDGAPRRVGDARGHRLGYWS
jgi:hypothetical protein